MSDMFFQVYFDQERVQFLGRNGTFAAKGMELRENDGVVEFTPITSRGKLASCFIQIPIADLPFVINALTRIVEESK